MRIGHGYDAHKLAANRSLILGGVDIPYEKGLLAHSDGDVLIHAIIDSLLGAAGLGDVGQHFPDNDEKYKGISSVFLLEEVAKKLNECGFVIINIDATIIAQKPKLAEYIPEMKSLIAITLGITPNSINIKATTEEDMGFTGALQGISAHSVCLIQEFE